MKLPKNIEALGQVLMFGFGPDVLKGFIPAYLGKISLDSCVEYINGDKDLLGSVSQEDWAVLKRVARAAKLDITLEYVMGELEKSRPDLWAIITSTPGGKPWLDRQIQNCRDKLGMR